MQLIVSILIAQFAGVIGSVFTASSVKTWYVTLVKPAFNPPSWIFGPVWIILYTLMGIASYMVAQKMDAPGARVALTFYAVQLLLNALWSIIFFGSKQMGFAFAEIIVMLICIIITTSLFWRVSPVAGMLMIPYIAWVSFASYLNYSLWSLNK